MNFSTKLTPFFSLVLTCSHMRPAEPIFRERWRQVASLDCNEPAVKVALEIPQPNASKIYYDGCSMIDQHNRKRQDDVNLEKKLGTHDWAKRVNMSIFGMLVMDAYLMYIGCTQPDAEEKESMNEFIHKLADELIDWRTTTRAQRGAYHFHRVDSPPLKRRSVDLVHQTPTKKIKPTAEEGRQDSGKKCLGYCRECKTRRTIQLCSHCDNPMVPVCDANKRVDCWSSHCQRFHANEMCNMPSAASSVAGSSQRSSNGYSSQRSSQGYY